MLIRLQKYLARCGIASRRNAEKLILEGHVKVNGHIILKLGTCVHLPGDIITLDNKKIKPEKKKYIAIHKPRGVLCTMKDGFGRRIVTHFLEGIKERVYHVGRLDKNSEGLLLLTNDGDFAHRVLHPSTHVSKTYIVEVTGTLSNKDTCDLEEGITINGKKTQPIKIKVKERSNNYIVLEITLFEGKKRQIRRMLQTKDLRVIRLKRIRIGNLHIKNLAPGQFKVISQRSANKIFLKKIKKF